MMDSELCYRAVRSRDARFDGWFYTAVTTTGIYCRPSCPAVTPKRANVRFYPTAAAAQAAGFRACRRCRPDATPGSPEWNARADLVGRAMRLIADGVVDREGVAGLARRLGYSERHLNRQLVAEVGAGPLALARAQRARTARVLLETTELPVSEVAFAAGFASVRQFNDTIRMVFAATPTQLRRAPSRRAPAAAGTIGLRLPYRVPFEAAGLLGFLAARAVPGVEAGDAGGYRRTLRLPHGAGTVELTPGGDGGAGWVRCTLVLADLRDLGVAVQRCRRLLDLDADPVAIDQQLGRDPLLGPLVGKAPGRRVPGAVDGAELAVRAVLGQQVSVAGARTVAGQLTRRLGTPLPTPDGPLTHLFPSPEALAEADPALLPMPAARRRAIQALAGAVAGGEIDLDPGADRERTAARLLALPGVGPWTVAYVAMRVLADPDAFPAADLGLRRAVERLGHPGDPAALTALAERWRPWRAYACQYLWASVAPSAGPPAERPTPTPSRRRSHPKRGAAMPTRTSGTAPGSAVATRYTVVPSPIGDLLLSDAGAGLSGLELPRADGTAKDPGDGWERDDDHFADAAKQLDAYFAGELTDFTMPLDVRGTPFQRRVWQALRDIPYGETVSYGQLADRVGQPRAARAVGLANNRNRIAIIIPCHRVIGADGSLTGYGGGLDRKRHLLALETGTPARAASRAAGAATPGQDGPAPTSARNGPQTTLW